MENHKEALARMVRAHGEQHKGEIAAGLLDGLSETEIADKIHAGVVASKEATIAELQAKIAELEKAGDVPPSGVTAADQTARNSGGDDSEDEPKSILEAMRIVAAETGAKGVEARSQALRRWPSLKTGISLLG